MRGLKFLHEIFDESSRAGDHRKKGSSSLQVEIEGEAEGNWKFRDQKFSDSFACNKFRKKKLLARKQLQNDK